MADADTPPPEKAQRRLNHGKGTLENLADAIERQSRPQRGFLCGVLSENEQEAGNLHIEAHLSEIQFPSLKMLLNLGKFQLNAAGTITNFRQPKLDVVVETNAFDINPC